MIRHGECYVLDDGAETDLDLGNYYRFLDGIKLTSSHSITTGKIYMSVIQRERQGAYLGRTVQVVPHIVDAIIESIEKTAKLAVDNSNVEPDSMCISIFLSDVNLMTSSVCCIELGGTVGDIESAPFIEAMRSLRRRAGRNNFLQVHVSLIPLVGGEQKVCILTGMHDAVRLRVADETHSTSDPRCPKCWATPRSGTFFILVQARY